MEMHLVHTNKEGEIAVLGFLFSTKQKCRKPLLKLAQSRSRSRKGRRAQTMDNRKGSKGKERMSKETRARSKSGNVQNLGAKEANAMHHVLSVSEVSDVEEEDVEREVSEEAQLKLEAEEDM